MSIYIYFYNIFSKSVNFSLSNDRLEPREASKFIFLLTLFLKSVFKSVLKVCG